MDEEDIHQPHDKLFKAGFSDPATAAGLLRWQLPDGVSRHIDWDRLQLEPGSFIDSHYRHSESDLLFSAPFADSECLIHVLFEHQIQEDPGLALRLLRYMVRIWEARLKSHPDAPRLPPILPVVLAQNAEPWLLPQNFAALLDIPAGLAAEILPFTPDFAFRLIQLSAMPFDAIRGTPAGIMILRTMKAERLARLLADPVWDEALLVQIPREILELLIRYMLRADLDLEAFNARVHAIHQAELQRTTMTLADQLLQKGRHEGRQEGRQEGRISSLRENVVDTLEIRFSRVPDGLRAHIEAITDESTLRTLHKAAVQAASIGDFARLL